MDNKCVYFHINPINKETRSKISKTLKGKPWTEARRNAVKIKDIK